MSRLLCNFPFAPVPNWLMRRTEVTATGKLIYGRLRQYAAASGQAWPSYKTLAKEVGVSRRQVINVVAELEEAKLVVVTLHDHKSNHYSLPKHEWMDGEKFAPSPVKSVSPDSETHCTSGSEVGFTQRDKVEEIEEEKPVAPSPCKKRRERWQIEEDIKSVERQRERVCAKDVIYDRQRFNDVLTPEGRAKSEKLKKRRQELEAELLDA